MVIIFFPSKIYSCDWNPKVGTWVHPSSSWNWIEPCCCDFCCFLACFCWRLFLCSWFASDWTLRFWIGREGNPETETGLPFPLLRASGAGTTTGLGTEGKGLMVPSYLTSATYPVASLAVYLWKWLNIIISTY